MSFATPATASSAGAKTGTQLPLGTPACPAALQSISTKRLLVLHSLNDYGAQTMGRVELSSVSHAAKRNTFISRQQCELTRRDGGLTLRALHTNPMRVTRPGEEGGTLVATKGLGEHALQVGDIIEFGEPWRRPRRREARLPRRGDQGRRRPALGRPQGLGGGGGSTAAAAPAAAPVDDDDAAAEDALRAARRVATPKSVSFAPTPPPAPAPTPPTARRRRHRWRRWRRRSRRRRRRWRRRHRWRRRRRRRRGGGTAEAEAPADAPAESPPAEEEALPAATQPDPFGALASRFEEQLSQTSGAEAEERGNTQPDPYDAHAAAEAARPAAKRPAPLFGLDCDVKRARGGENAGVNPFKVNPFGLP